MKDREFFDNVIHLLTRGRADSAATDSRKMLIDELITLIGINQGYIKVEEDSHGKRRYLAG